MKIFKWGTRILLIIIAIIMLFPLIWNIYSAFKTNTEFLSNPFSLPSGLEWDNFARAIQKPIWALISGTPCSWFWKH